ncbi:hypothetical protein FRB99_001046 [Tulasnella sp. 403]|nr:hypothetical protein FRB99_001046 [Tulasnella sp. 403]
MAPSTVTRRSSSGITIVNLDYAPQPAPGQPIFTWSYTKDSPDQFSVWFFNTDPKASNTWVLSSSNFPTRNPNTTSGTKQGRTTVDALRGVVGTYEIALCKNNITAKSPSPSEVYSKSNPFRVHKKDFQT